MDLPVLTILIAVPALTALVIALLPSGNREVIRGAALFGSALTFAASVGVLFRFEATAGFQMVESASWIPEWGIGYRLGIDGVSIFLVVLTALIVPLAVVAAYE